MVSQVNAGKLGDLNYERGHGEMDSNVVSQRLVLANLDTDPLLPFYIVAVLQFGCAAPSGLDMGFEASFVGLSPVAPVKV